MLAKIISAAAFGLDGKQVEVEVDISRGLPGLKIVGLPDKAVEEARERVASAIKNSDAKFPNKKVTINLAPADLKKEGSIYDLPIAIGILQASGQIKTGRNEIYLGELALDGRLRPIKGALVYGLLAKSLGIEKIYLPRQNVFEVSCINGLRVYGLDNLNRLLFHLRGDKRIAPIVDEKIRLNEISEPEFDISAIKGQEWAKRGALIAMAGGHNLLMGGPPGTGKTLLAKSLISVMPPISKEEILEVSKLYSIAGKLKSDSLITSRPFRAPHHSASSVAIVGGGQNPKPGEISLAHKGILFLDEVAEFSRDVIEALRQPLEERKVTISRAKETIDYPADFILIAAQNPCPCGYLTHPKKECRCTSYEIRRYQKKISGPILDRFELSVEFEPVSFKKLDEEEVDRSQTERFKEAIKQARIIQEKRFRKEPIVSNSQMDNRLIKKYADLNSKSKVLLREAIDSLGLSARAYFNCLKVARTIADIKGSKKISAQDIGESLQFRRDDQDVV
jgi:magnesium chelatase family protein